MILGCLGYKAEDQWLLSCQDVELVMAIIGEDEHKGKPWPDCAHDANFEEVDDDEIVVAPEPMVAEEYDTPLDFISAEEEGHCWAIQRKIQVAKEAELQQQAKIDIASGEMRRQVDEEDPLE